MYYFNIYKTQRERYQNITVFMCYIFGKKYTVPLNKTLFIKRKKTNRIIRVSITDDFRWKVNILSKIVNCSQFIA